MTDNERLQILLTALESIGRNLAALAILARRGNRLTVIKGLDHMVKRCKEIKEETT
jgi:hypothetical protein